MLPGAEGQDGPLYFCAACLRAGLELAERPAPGSPHAAAVAESRRQTELSFKTRGEKNQS